MPVIGSAMTTDGGGEQTQKPYYSYQLYFNRPLTVSLQTRQTCTVGTTGRKYPQLSIFMQVSLSERDGGGNIKRTSISLVPEDWYRWMITVGNLLSNAKSIYLENGISDKVSEDDFKIVNFKGEVLMLVPITAKVENDLIPAVRIIINEPANFADFPLVDIKGMHNILNRIDVLTMGMCANVLGDKL